MKTKHPFCGFAMLLCLSPLAHAATRTWDGGGADNNWTTAANWDAAIAPGDDLVFPGGAGVDVFSLNNTNNSAANTAFNSITISGTNYTLRGNAIILTNGISHASGGTNTLILNIQLNAHQIFASTIAAGTLIVNGNINLNGQNLTNDTTGRMNLSGVISGTGNIIKTGAGTLRLMGVAGNVYAGSMTVNDGVLEMSKSGLHAIPGALNIGDGIGAVDSAVVRLLAPEQIGHFEAVSIEDDGLLDLAGLDDTIGALTLTGGDVATGGGLLTLGGTLSGTSTAANLAVVSGFLDLGASPRTFDIADGPNSPDVRIDAGISGTETLTKTGNGELELDAANINYTGLTILAQGFLTLQDDNALGSTVPGTVVSNGATVSLLFNTHIGGEALTLNGNGATSLGALFSAFGSNSWAGNVTLASDSRVAVQTNDFLNLTGAISGSGGLTKDFPGTLILSGASANTYAGATSVNQGTLLLNKSSVSMPTAIPTQLEIGQNLATPGAAVVQLLASNQIADGASVIIYASGRLALNGFLEEIGPLTLEGGNVTTGAGTLTLGGDVTVNASTNAAALIQGRLSLGGATRTFTVATSPGWAAPLGIIATISDGGAAAGIVKSGPGNMTLQVANSYSGTTTVSQGPLSVFNSRSLGSTNAGTTVSSNAVLSLSFSVNITNESLTLNGGSKLSSADSTNRWLGDVTLNGTATLETFTANEKLDLLGVVSGAGGLTLTTLAGSVPGRVEFGGAAANTYTGTTTVRRSTLLLNKPPGTTALSGPLVIDPATPSGAATPTVKLAANDQIADTAAVTLTARDGDSYGVFDLDGFNEMIGRLVGGGNVILGSGVLVAGTDNTSSLYSGIISGTGSFGKSGNGTLTLSGNSTYSGFTTVNAGALLIHGGLTNTGVSVNQGTLGGTGYVGFISNPANAVPKTISPGASPGILASGSAVFDADTTFVVELRGASPGSGYDQLNVAGLVNLENARLTATLGFLSAVSNTFTIIESGAGVTNTFSGLPEGAMFDISGTPFAISYTGGSGNDVVLTQLAATQLPLLNIQRSGNTNVVLLWATNFTGYALQANTNLNTNVWSVVSPAPAVSGTNNVVTNAAIESGKFYRLRAP